ncbi:MAG: S49 family peptidase [Planctomycetota bacterium]|nr:S49 family peptidase [Planctomycetota bacterium]
MRAGEEQRDHVKLMSPYKPASEKEIAVLQELVDTHYERFVRFVSEGRNLSREEVLEFADGRIFTPERALEYGLVDKIAHVDGVYDDIRNAHGDVSFVRYDRLPTLMETLMHGVSHRPSFEERLLPYLAQEGTPLVLYMFVK